MGYLDNDGLAYLWGKIKAKIEAKIKANIVQSDWYQNDSTKPDHVKNRPGGYIGYTLATKTQKITLNSNGAYTSGELFSSIAADVLASGEAGVPVSVTVDGVLYENVPVWSEGYGGVFGCGDGSFTSYPFRINSGDYIGGGTYLYTSKFKDKANQEVEVTITYGTDVSKTLIPSSMVETPASLLIPKGNNIFVQVKDVMGAYIEWRPDSTTIPGFLFYRDIRLPVASNPTREQKIAIYSKGTYSFGTEIGARYITLGSSVANSNKKFKFTVDDDGLPTATDEDNNLEIPIATQQYVKDYIDNVPAVPAVRYTSQTLTDDQKAQARKNIAAEQLPVGVEVLETILENVTLAANVTTYTLPTTITLDADGLYYLAYTVPEDPSFTACLFGRVNDNKVTWISSTMGVTLTDSTLTANWSFTDKRVVSIYKVQINTRDSLNLASIQREGYSAVASGLHSHAEGRDTTASGLRAHAEGYQTTASGYSSHAEGEGTIASGYASHAEGIYNIEDKSLVHIVGNGNSNTNRSNAHTLSKTGEAWFAGDVYVGSTGGKNKDEGSKKLATEEYAESLVVQADMAENDSTSPAYVKNRLAWSEVIVEAVEITWDGEVGDKTTVTVDDNNVLVKVSDQVLTVEQSNELYLTFSDSDMGDYIINAGTEGNYYNGIVAIVSTAGWVYTNTDSDDTVSVTFPEAGIYFCKYTNSTSTWYVNLLKRDADETVHQIDPKYTQPREMDATLLASDWTGNSAPYSYTLYVYGVTMFSHQEFCPGLNITTAQLAALQAANIQDGGQGKNSVTLLAFGTKPTIDLPIRVLY